MLQLNRSAFPFFFIIIINHSALSNGGINPLSQMFFTDSRPSLYLRSSYIAPIFFHEVSSPLPQSAYESFSLGHPPDEYFRYPVTWRVEFIAVFGTYNTFKRFMTKSDFRSLLVLLSSILLSSKTISLLQKSPVLAIPGNSLTHQDSPFFVLRQPISSTSDIPFFIPAKDGIQ